MPLLRVAGMIALLLSIVGSASAQHRIRVLLPDGSPAIAVQISIPGHPGSFRTNASGEVTLPGKFELPLTMIAIGGDGEIFPPIVLDELSPETTVVSLEVALNETLTVTSGVAPNIEAPPASGSSTVGRQEIEQRIPEHLVDAVARVPGIQNRGEGASAVPVVRGLSGGRTTIILDDARLTAERRAGPSATFLDPFTLGSIEVSRGPGSVAYGSDAFGGVVHARSRDPVPGEPMLLFDSSGSIGGREQLGGGLIVSRDVGRGALQLMVQAREGDDFEDGNGSTIPNSSYEDRGASLRFVQPTSVGLLRFGFAVNQSRDVGAPAADALVQRTYYPEEDSVRLTVSWDAPPPRGFTSFDFRAAIGSYGIVTNRERLPSSSVTRQISSADVEANDLSLRAAATRIGETGRLQLGVDLASRFNLEATGFTQAFDSSGSPATRTDEVSIEDARKIDGGIFALYDRTLTSRWSASAGLRLDAIRVENRGGFFGDRSRSDQALSGHFAISYMPAAGITSSLQVASGYREPSLSDRYFRGVSGRGFVVGNPDLEPERSLQFDGAFRITRGGRSFALLAYHYTIDDLIERFRAGSDFAFRNRGEAEVQGLELEFTTPLFRNMTFETNATIARGEAEGGDPLDDISAPNANIGLRWASARASIFGYAFVFDDDDRPGPVEIERPGYATVDLGGSWKVTSNVELRLNLRNLFDRTYAGSADANASLAPGRSATLGVQGKF